MNIISPVDRDVMLGKTIMANDGKKDRLELRVDLHYDCCCGHRRYAMLYDSSIEYLCDLDDARGSCHGFVDGVGCTLSKHKCNEIMTETARNDRWVAQEFMSWEIFTRLSLPPFFCMISNSNDTLVSITLVQYLVDITTIEIKKIGDEVVDVYLVYFPVNEKEVRESITNFDTLVAGARK
jgi:hypothetical protein